MATKQSKQPKTIKFKSLQELKEAIEMGLDIECFIYGDRYWIGAYGEIALCPDGDADVYKDAEDLLNNHRINGKPLIEIWQDIDLYGM